MAGQHGRDGRIKKRAKLGASGYIPLSVQGPEKIRRFLTATPKAGCWASILWMRPMTATAS